MQYERVSVNIESSDCSGFLALVRSGAAFTMTFSQRKVIKVVDLCKENLNYESSMEQ